MEVALAASSLEAGLLHQEQASAEEAYRHGYSQGYIAAYHDAHALARRGFSRPKEVANILGHHALNVVHPWRLAFVFDDPARVPPPKMDRPDWYMLRHQTFARDGRTCASCGSSRLLEIDHIKTVQDGGLPVLENLRVLCRTCNRSRPRTERAAG